MSAASPMTDSRHSVCVFVQARMSSRRFPGKVLAPFLGRPMIDAVIQAVTAGVDGFVPVVPVIVVTSDQPTDDPLAAYLGATNRPFVRGPLNDVLQRFRVALAQWPCDWILRVNADSPLLSPEVVREVLAPERRAGGCDIVTTVHPRTFPRGQNVELMRAALLAVPDEELDPEDREHVTRYFYRSAERYRIVNVESDDAALAELDLAVDTLQDLQRLEHLPLGQVRLRTKFAAAR